MSQNYKLTLVNVFWTENGIDTRFFKTVNEQRQYFDILTEGVQAPFVNFQMGDNITTRVTYKDNSARSVEELMRCNYCVVQKFNEDKTQEIERRYFFAYPRNQDSMGQIIVDLSLDDLQTNYFRYKDTIAPCTITKAHINRWVEDNSNTVSFNGDIDSKLFERENITEVAKRLTKRTKLNFKVCEDESINTWYNEHIWGWVYIYVDDTDYKVYSQGVNPNAMVNTSLLHQQFGYFKDGYGDCYLKSTLPILAFPLYKKQQGRLVFKKSGWSNIVINNNGFDYFKNFNNGSSYIKSLKFSIRPPCQFPINNYELSGENLVYTGVTSSTPSYSRGSFTAYRTSDSSGYGLLNVFSFENSFELNYNSSVDFTFLKSNIINSNKNPIHNPKLLNSDYLELKLTNERGSGFSYDIQKLNMKSLVFEYTEALTPDITRSYLRVKNPTGVYISETDENLTGLVDSADLSLMVDNDQLSQMLANNKNFYLQNYLNIGEKALMGGIGGAIAGGGYGALISGGVNAGMSLINMNLTVDNMRNAPNDLKNANGNAYFNTMYCEPGLYIEEYEILENEKQIINDEMFKNGYVVNLIGKVSDYDNIRHTFNYLSANVETISAPISIEEKERLKQKLQNVRFWNTDTIDYENAKNYERWLNNEQ